VTRNDIAL